MIGRLKYLTLSGIFLIGFICVSSARISTDDIPTGVTRLMKAYPKQVIGYKDGYLLMKNGSKLLYSDNTAKNHLQLLENPDIEDMFHYPYSKQKGVPLYGQDPGRIRNLPFLKAMYGKTKAETETHLVNVIWCPRLAGNRIKFTSVNGAAQALKAVSAEIDKVDAFRKYIRGATTYNYRKIAGSDRLSTHSFGIAIDIKVDSSDYWLWNYPKATENDSINYRNKIPMQLVEIFEKHGFIWGGRWYHYDTVHFEYRPEMLH